MIPHVTHRDLTEHAVASTLSIAAVLGDAYEDLTQEQQVFVLWHLDRANDALADVMDVLIGAL